MVENILDPFKTELECTQNRPMWNPIQRDQLLTVYGDPRLLLPANQLFQLSIHGEPVVNCFYILSSLPPDLRVDLTGRPLSSKVLRVAASEDRTSGDFAALAIRPGVTLAWLASAPPSGCRSLPLLWVWGRTGQNKRHLWANVVDLSRQL